MNTLVHIPRPNQGFHVGFAMTCAVALSRLNLSSVDILICNDSDHFCPIKTYFDKTPLYGSCIECDSQIAYFSELINRFNSLNAKIFTLYYTKDFLGDEYVQSPEIAQHELEEFILRYRNHSRDLHLLNDPIDYAWLSELLSLNQISSQDILLGNYCNATAISLINLSIRTRLIAKNFLASRVYDKYVVYNARHTHARAFWRSLQAFLPLCDCYIHESGVRSDSFLLLNNCSPEATFENLPPEIYPFGIPYWLMNDFQCSIDLPSPKITEVVRYFMDKLTGRRGFYHNRVVVSGATKPKKTMQDSQNFNVLILLASVDEVACPYPIDRVLFEHRLIPLIIKYLSSHGFNVLVKLHPRSNCQLTNKRYVKNSYKKFVDLLSSIADNNSLVHIYHPKSKESSYDLMAFSDVAISLFSIAAIEAQALGTPAIVHGRCRGSTFSSASINSLDIGYAFVQFKEILSLLKDKCSDPVYRRESAQQARIFLTEVYSQNEITLPGFSNFLPHVSFEWMNALEKSIISSDHDRTDMMLNLYQKLGFYNV